MGYGQWESQKSLALLALWTLQFCFEYNIACYTLRFSPNAKRPTKYARHLARQRSRWCPLEACQGCGVWL